MLFPLKPTEDSPRMFENNFLDIVSRTHWIFVPVLYLPISGFLLWYGTTRLSVSLPISLALAFAGIVSWTLTEYWLHRTLFHWIPSANWGKKMHFFIHGVHHDWPHDRFRLVMPPAGSLSLFFVFLGLFWMLLGKYALPFQAGFTIGYTMYDLTHYYVHYAKPSSRLMKFLQRHHLNHHFHPRCAERKFSITAPFWDKMFATYEPEPAPPKSTNA